MDSNYLECEGTLGDCVCDIIRESSRPETARLVFAGHRGHELSIDAGGMGDDEAEECVWCEECSDIIWYVDSDCGACC